MDRELVAEKRRIKRHNKCETTDDYNNRNNKRLMILDDKNDEQRRQKYQTRNTTSNKHKQKHKQKTWNRSVFQLPLVTRQKERYLLLLNHGDDNKTWTMKTRTIKTG